MNTAKRWSKFNEEVRRGLTPYAKKKGWKIMKTDEPSFKKGKAEVYMHTDDAVIFSTINDKLVGKNYRQDMDLFSGNYKKEKVRRYINQGKASINYLDKRVDGSKASTMQKVRKKIKARRTRPTKTGGNWITKETNLSGGW